MGPGVICGNGVGEVKRTKVLSMGFYFCMMYEAGELVLQEVSQFKVGLAGLEFELCGRRGYWRCAGVGNGGGGVEVVGGAGGSGV